MGTPPPSKPAASIVTPNITPPPLYNTVPSSPSSPSIQLQKKKLTPQQLLAMEKAAELKVEAKVESKVEQMVERQLEMEVTNMSPEIQQEYQKVERKGEDFVMAVGKIFGNQSGAL